MSFNRIIIVGNLGREPELRYTPQGVAVCSFTMATNEKRKNKGGEMEDVTTWFKVTLWREKAEAAARYLTKGSTVYIEGRIRIEEWTDRDNNNRYTLDVQATDMQFVGSGPEKSGESVPEFRKNALSALAASVGADGTIDGSPAFPSTPDPDDSGDIPF